MNMYKTSEIFDIDSLEHTMMEVIVCLKTGLYIIFTEQVYGHCLYHFRVR